MDDLETQEMKNAQRNKLSKFVHFLTDIDKKDLTLKFFFDNIRNYALASGLFLAGKFLLTFTEHELLWNGGNIFFGYMLMLYALILFILNLIQPIHIIRKYDKILGLSMFTYMLFSTFSFLISIALGSALIYSKLG